jgi:hypothetical protein
MCSPVSWAVQEGSEAVVKKALLTGVAALLLATGAAHAAEILITLMHDEAGRRSIHQVSLNDGYCVELVTRFGKQAKNGLPVTLTLPEPDFTGVVIEAYCVMPDGSTGAKFEAPTI